MLTKFLSDYISDWNHDIRLKVMWIKAYLYVELNYKYVDHYYNDTVFQRYRSLDSILWLVFCAKFRKITMTYQNEKGCIEGYFWGFSSYEVNEKDFLKAMYKYASGN